MNISPPEENYIKSDDEDNEEEETFCDTWIQYFCSLPGNEFYCEVDKEYIEDSFNLFGLRNYFDSSTTDYSDALAFIVDKQPSAAAEGHSIDVTGIQKMAEILYALIHSRFIITSRGLDVMRVKYESLEFGCCPRSLCENQATIPTGTNDYPFNGLTKVYCPRCRDIYSPQAVHSQTLIDGCAFGTTFAQLFFLTFLDLVPDPATQPFVRNIPRVFGFRIHPSAYTSVPTSRKRKVEQIETTKATEITEVTEITEIVNENEDEFDKNKKACLDVPDPKPDTNPDNAGNGDDLMDSNKSPLGIDSAIGLEMNSSRKVTELDILLSPLQSEIEKHQTRPKDYSFTSPIPKAKPK